jgi:glycosyltransferase involved in cell wall biosynthesis
MKLIGQPLIENANSVIFSTLREMEKASTVLGTAQVDICNWGIEVPDLSESQSWRIEMRHRLGIDSETKVLLFLGRINTMKRPLETALAFQAIKPQGWKFIVVGYPEDNELLGQVKSKCDPNYVSYYPPLEGQDKWKLLAASDAFVNLSHRENFGRSAVEAAAVGLPVLISDGVDLYPDFQAYDAAEIACVESQINLEKDLYTFLNLSPGHMKAMGSRGKRLVSEKFTESAFNSRLKSLMDKYSKSTNS